MRVNAGDPDPPKEGQVIGSAEDPCCGTSGPLTEDTLFHDHASASVERSYEAFTAAVNSAGR